MAVSKVPPAGAPQRQPLNVLKEKVAKVEAKVVSSALKGMTAAKGKIFSAQKNPLQTDKETRKDTSLAFKRVVK